MRTRATTAAIVLALATSACAVGHGAKENNSPARRDLAARPLPTSQATATTAAPEAPTTSTAPRRGGTTGSVAATTTEATAPVTTAATVPSARLLVSVPDARGDIGRQGPAYADAIDVKVEDLGASVRLTVDVAGALPQRTASGEVMGIGVDLYRSSTHESDYQAFADGENDGWYAYLDTPSGFVRYPGTFEIGGSRLAFVVPWSGVGDLHSARVSAFIDWSGRGTLTNTASSDHVPDSGSVAFSR